MCPVSNSFLLPCYFEAYRLVGSFAVHEERERPILVSFFPGLPPASRKIRISSPPDAGGVVFFFSVVLYCRVEACFVTHCPGRWSHAHVLRGSLVLASSYDVRVAVSPGCACVVRDR